MMKLENILGKVERHGFQQAFFCNPAMTTGVPSGVGTLLLLLKSYLPWDAEVDSFYIAENLAYHSANEIISELSNLGEAASLLPAANYKMLCSSMPAFRQGRNSLHYHQLYGSRFCLQLIGLTSVFSHSFIQPLTSKDMCGNCKLCAEACPTNAIRENGFQRAKCLRSYMLSGRPIPVEYRFSMGERLLGCDICQRVCPYNHGILAIQCGYKFTVSRLLPPAASEIAFYKMLIGTNYSNANRLCAQAALVAGNQRDVSLLTQLIPLTTARSEVVRAHTTWAVEQITR